MSTCSRCVHWEHFAQMISADGMHFSLGHCRKIRRPCGLTTDEYTCADWYGEHQPKAEPHKDDDRG